ncbi:tRNA pseudouridine synthase A-like isoform X2 [Portunus trituberculatus]|uniref:tRNA pseudouridine synthase A-like isoform X2 n=1 Tax=Portunus trituberculatus TaxID=210409 RepID=UPI001E1CBE4F|nr:tRNA pseudouridine synthase A-like isoform X2 [Portunus trituberculatus]
MQRCCAIRISSLMGKLPRCGYLPLPKERCLFRMVPVFTTIQHRKYCTRDSQRVFYDPKPDMSEEEVKHIKLEPVPPVVEPIAKRFALLLSFNGQGYYGMQRNMTGKTIEDHLLKAMLDTGLITPREFIIPKIFSFQRSSRTDKGVSAARLLVSCDLMCDKLEASEIKRKLNQHLNDEIRVMAVFRTIKTFSGKAWCDSRTYSYTCPSYAFASYREIIRDSYRLPEDGLAEIRKLFAEYIGIHNFHNFTSGIKPHDQRARRRILDIECSEPFEQNSLEWITIRIKGLSFLLHQIRKMVAVVIAIRRGMACENFIPQALSRDYTFLPIAPGLGLVLENQHFDNYNKKYGSKGTHEMLTWDSEAKEIEEFRHKNIITPIMNAEMKERSMLEWLRLFHGYCTDFDFTMVKESEFDAKNKRPETRSVGLFVSFALLTEQKDTANSIVDGTHASHLVEECYDSHSEDNEETYKHPSDL